MNLILFIAVRAQHHDPLLTIAKIGLIFIGAVFAIYFVANLAPLVMEPGSTDVPLKLSGLNSAFHESMAILNIGKCIALILGICFVFDLHRIVHSIQLGDPFTLTNVNRFSRMGLYVLFAPLVQLIASTLVVNKYLSLESNQIADAFKDIPQTETMLPFPRLWAGFIFAMILFIMARIIKLGFKLRVEPASTII